MEEDPYPVWEPANEFLFAGEQFEAWEFAVDASEDLPLDGVVSSNNLTGATVANLDDDPDAPDASWATATSVGDTELRVSFPTPTDPLRTGAGFQEFRVLLRKDAAGGNDPAYDIELWEEGGLSPLAILASGVTLSSDTGEVVSVTWDASLLGVQDGSAVELRVFGDRSNGNPSVRRTVEVGAVEWVAATSATELAGLYYLRARYYHPETGRFLSSDPFGGITTMPLSQNGYPYVLANPVNLLDPSGMCVLGAYCPEPLKRAGEAIEDIGKGAAQIGEDLSYGIYVGSYETLQLLGHLPDEVEIALLPTEVVLTIVEADALWTAAALDYLATGNLLTSTTIPKRKAAVGGLAIGGRTRLTSGKDVTSLAPSSLGFPLVMIPSSGFTLTSNGPSVIDERDAALCAATQGI